VESEFGGQDTRPPAEQAGNAYVCTRAHGADSADTSLLSIRDLVWGAASGALGDPVDIRWGSGGDSNEEPMYKISIKVFPSDKSGL